jgi:7-cyano-7-deazaguanine synthase
MNKKAVILLSGGLDSTTVLAYAKSEGFDCYALSFSYGQRHSAELNAAKNIAKTFNVLEHKIFEIDLSQFQGSALTDHSIQVPDYTADQSIPVTYVPARNTIFLSIALGWAEILLAEHLFIGVSCVDYSHYPDCRPEFISAYQTMASIATKAGIEGCPVHIHTPLITLSKKQTIELGKKLGIDYSITTSCYQADKKGKACGRCDSCTFRRRGFEEAGLVDPTQYQ